MKNFLFWLKDAVFESVMVIAGVLTVSLVLGFLAGLCYDLVGYGFDLYHLIVPQ